MILDLTVSDQSENLVEITINEFTGIDILINSAVLSCMRPLLDFEEERWYRIFDTDCEGAFLLSRAAARKIIDRGGAKIINFTMVGAETGSVGLGVYHASKAALKMLARCMAEEWDPHNIGINAVGPGLTRTEFSRPIWDHEESAERHLSAVPKGRVAEPEEIAGTAFFLASDTSNFITGQAIIWVADV